MILRGGRGDGDGNDDEVFVPESASMSRFSHRLLLLLLLLMATAPPRWVLC